MKRHPHLLSSVLALLEKPEKGGVESGVRMSYRGVRNGAWTVKREGAEGDSRTVRSWCPRQAEGTSEPLLQDPEEHGGGLGKEILDVMASTPTTR